MAMTFETLIKIAASFVGGAAFHQAAAATKAVEKQANLANFSLKKLAMSAAGVVLGFKGIEKVKDFLKAGIDAAREEQKAQETLGLIMSKTMAKRHINAAFIERDKKGLIELADVMEKTGVKSSAMEALFGKLIQTGLSPKKIADNAKAFEGTMVKLEGSLKVGAAEGADAGHILRMAIENGMARPLVQAEILTKKQASALTKMHSAAERWAYLQPILAKNSGLVASKMETTEGKLFRASMSWEKLGKTIGAPFLKSQQAFTIASGKIAVALQPLAERMAPKLDAVMAQIAKALESSAPAIAKFGDSLEKGFDWLVKNWSTVSQACESIVGAILAFKTIEGVIDVINKFNSAISAFQKVGGLLGMLTTPTGLIIAGLLALAAVIYLVITHWDQVKAAALQAWAATQQAWGQASSWFTQQFEAIKEATRGVWEPLVGPLSRLWGEIQPIIMQIVNYIIDSFKTVPATLQYLWAGVVKDFEILKQIITIVSPIVQQAFQNWITAVSWVSSNIIAPIVNAFADIIAKIKVGDLSGAFQTWVNVVQTIQTTVIDAIVNLFQSLPGQIASAVAGVAAAITGPFQQAYDQITGWFSNLGAKIAGLVGQANSASAAANKAAASIPGGTAGTGQTTTSGYQLGGIAASPQVARIAERVPEMVIPLEGTSRSRGLLTDTASMLGMRGFGGTSGAQTQTVSVSIPINISGVPSGQEGAIGREVQRAMQDPIRELLRQLKKARGEEQRLSYA